MLINAVRDVAGALYDLIHATKSAAGKGPNDSSMLTLKESAKVIADFSNKLSFTRPI